MTVILIETEQASGSYLEVGGDEIRSLNLPNLPANTQYFIVFS
jgi:hypothetical protein